METMIDYVINSGTIISIAVVMRNFVYLSATTEDRDHQMAYEL